MVAVSLLAGLVAIGLLLPGDTADDDPLATPTTDSAASTTDGDTSPADPATTTTTTLGYEEFTLSGSGSEMIPFAAPDDLATVLHITHEGQSTFMVQTLDAESEPIEMLVDTEGTYEGSRAINLIVGDVISGIEIIADGDWAITATYLGSLDRNLDEASGKGDDVVLMDISSPAMSISHNGESDFSVFMWSFESQGFLIQASGSVDRTVPVAMGGAVIEIRADGSWRLSTRG